MTVLQETYQTDRPVVLVTGSGARRVGQTVIRHFAGLGCDVVLHANTSMREAEACAQDLIDRHGVRAHVTQGALEDGDTCERVVRESIDQMGRLDIVVNSAAIWSPTPIDKITYEEMRRYFEINSLATFFVSRAAGQFMMSTETGGCIVNLGDWATTRPYLDHAAYFPSKGSIEVMTRSLAVEFGHRHSRVRVNCVQPGPVLLADDVPDEIQRSLAASTLAGRVGTPQDIAHAVQMLAENTFITGVCLPVDGGRSIFSRDGLQVGHNLG